MCNSVAVAGPAMAAADGGGALPPFAAELVGTINAASTALMLSIGHRTGLFEALAKGPATSEELAARAGLAERYVREWLGAMATGGIVTLAEGRYALPPDHAMFLGRDAAGGNMATMFQFIAVLGSVEDGIVDCFRNGGGLPYDAFDRFHEVMADESAQTVVAALEDHILPLVPGLAARLEAGIDVADIGCGSGRALVRLATLYPASRFTGYDLCGEAIAAGRVEAARLGLENLIFHAADAAALNGGAHFDLIFTFDAIHDQAKPAVALANIRRLLREGGIYICQEIDGHSRVEDNIGRPLAPFIYTISTMHCMTVSLAQGGDGLGAAWGEELARKMLAEAGFRDVRVERLPHDIMNAYYVCR